MSAPARPFQIVLEQLAKIAAAAARRVKPAIGFDSRNIVERGIRRGDAAHLRRWAKDGRGAEIYDKILHNKRGQSAERFALEAAFHFIMTTLELRQLAQFCDAEDMAFERIYRARQKQASREIRVAARALGDGLITPEDFAAYRDCKGAVARALSSRSPALNARQQPTRQRVIFCRVLSFALHNSTGRWHDAEVAALAEIAYDCEVSVDAVKRARHAASRSHGRSRTSVPPSW